MKIAFLIRSLAVGGAERQLVQLAIRGAAQGHEISVISLYPGGAFAGELRDNGVRMLTMEKRARWDLVRPLSRLLYILREERPDILHSYMPPANLLATLAGWVLPQLKVVWGIRASNLDLSRFDQFSNLTHIVERRISFTPRLIIINSHAGREHVIRNGFPAGKCVVVPNGIDSVRFQFNQVLRSNVRQEWGVTPEEILVGLIGRIDPSKGHETFLASAARLAQARPNLRFVCVGQKVGLHGAQMEALGASLGLGHRLIWAGERSDMVAVHSALDVLCSASPSEGFSNVIGEAMACGTVCVVTNVGDSAWIVGLLGIVSAGLDVESLSAALVAGLHMVPRKEQEARARRQRVIELFSPDRLAHATFEHLQRVTAGGAF